MVTVAHAGVPLGEYTPDEIKHSFGGYGNAT
jgi:Holliday junction resolvasome RuvABC endonuclease subunit